MGLLAIVSAVASIVGAKKNRSAGSNAMHASDPFSPYRAQTQSMLMSLLQDPSKVLEDPIFKSSLDQGMQAVSRSMGKQWESGQAASALYKYGTSFAQDYLMKQEDMLARMSGAYTIPNAYAAGLGAYTKGNDDISQGIGNILGDNTVTSIFRGLG